MDDFEKLLNNSYRFLSFRPRSEKEVRDYLKKKSQSAGSQIDPKIIESIIEKLKEHKFINDEEFTRWFIEQRTLLKPKASRLIKLELKQKGIAKELIDSFFEGNENQDLPTALKLAQKRMVRYAKLEDKRKVYEKLGRFLASKGFNWDTIKTVIDQVLAK